MGGWNSGRRNQGGKATTNGYRTLDVRRLQREGVLTPGCTFIRNWLRDGQTVASIGIKVETARAILTYQHLRGAAEWQPMDYAVVLDRTPCTFGGRRAWFRCPSRGCGRRVALLYLGSSGIFACRHCNRLTYPSQRENAQDRAARRAEKIRNRLGWEAGSLNPPGDKPKGMHWRTFERLVAAQDAFAGVMRRGVMRRMRALGWAGDCSEANILEALIDMM